MNLSKDLVPLIRKKDMDMEATKFLSKYCPEALEKPMAVPVEDIAELEMDLEIDYVNIDRESDTLGMMLFSDGAVELYDKGQNRYIRREYNKGTLLVESDLCETGNRGRERFTIAHEMVHWEKHQLRFMMLALQDETAATACRCPEEKVYKPRTPEDWMEWQADNLAASILMPAEMFRQKAEEVKERYKDFFGLGFSKFQEKGLIPEIVKDMIINNLATSFQVSRQATEIRLSNLGIAI